MARGAAVAREWALLLRSVGRDEEGFKLMDEAALLSVRRMGERAVRARHAKETG